MADPAPADVARWTADLARGMAVAARSDTGEQKIGGTPQRVRGIIAAELEASQRAGVAHWAVNAVELGGLEGLLRRHVAATDIRTSLSGRLVYALGAENAREELEILLSRLENGGREAFASAAERASNLADKAAARLAEPDGAPCAFIAIAAYAERSIAVHAARCGHDLVTLGRAVETWATMNIIARSRQRP